MTRLAAVVRLALLSVLLGFVLAALVWAAPSEVGAPAPDFVVTV